MQASALMHKEIRGHKGPCSWLWSAPLERGPQRIPPQFSMDEKGETSFGISL